MRQPNLKDSIAMHIDGVAASEALDSSGEQLLISGLDITDYEEGGAVLNWEHMSSDAPGASPNDIVGKVVYCKKVFKETDCENERQRKFWKELELPFLYVICRLFDAANHPGALAAAATIRDNHFHGEPLSLRFSVEGSTLERGTGSESNILKQCIARKLALTAKPCNRSAISGLLLDPNAPESFEKEPNKKATDLLAGLSEVSKREVLGRNKIGYGPEFAYEPLDLSKATIAGGYNAAPGTLTGGPALQVEDAGLRRKLHLNMARAAVRDWDGRGSIKPFLKSRLPDADPDFIEKFGEMVDEYKVKKAEPKIGKLDENRPLSIRGKPVRPTPTVDKPHFDEKAGVLRTPKGSIPMYIPSRDPQPGAAQSFHNSLNDPAVNKIHDYALKNWSRVHGLLKAGKLPDAVLMHATLFSQMSPNTPVPSQELMYSMDGDTILITCEKQEKKIVDFVPGDSVFGVNEKGAVVQTLVVALHDHGVLNGFEVTFEGGYQIVCSKNHKFLTDQGMAPLWRIASEELGVLSELQTQARWLAKPVRFNIFHRDQIQESSKELLILQRNLEREEISKCRSVAPGASSGSGGCYGENPYSWQDLETEKPGFSGSQYGWYQTLGKREAGRIQYSTSQSGGCYARMADDSPSRDGCSSGYYNRGYAEMAQREFGEVCREYSQDDRGTQNPQGWVTALKNGRVASKERYSYLGIYTDSLRRGEEAGGFCKSRPQDLGGGGRVLPFFYEAPNTSVLPSPSCQYTDSRLHAEQRMSASARCDIDSDGCYLFSSSKQYDEAGMASMAYSDAPLSNTGNLVLRKIVRIRSVGPKHMYDLEVSHPKHNFLLPNGVITSNSHLVDTMKETGIDARSPSFATIKDNWTGRDNPSEWPVTGGNHWSRIQSQLRIKNDSKLTNRKAGEIGGFMLANNKFENMAEYHKLHGKLSDLLKRHGTNTQTFTNELMQHKVKGELWNAQRERVKDKGQPDIGEYSGPVVRGLAPKTARYMHGMLGGGNSVVPDTHFIRHLFGLEKGGTHTQHRLDNHTIDYLKNVLWNPGNSKVLEGIDRYYNQNHDAVNHLATHPAVAGMDRKELTFPSFWKHWMAIVPHEAARDMGTAGHNEFTDHKPFWDTVLEHIDNRKPSMQKADLEAYQKAQDSVKEHMHWQETFGEFPAMVMYYGYMIPELLGEAGKPREGIDLTDTPNGDVDPVVKFEKWGIDLRITLEEMLKAEQITSDEAAKADAKQRDFPSQVISFQGKKVIPGHIRAFADVPGGIQDHTVLGHDAKHFYTVPVHPSKLQDWQPHQVERINKAGLDRGFNVEKWPEYQDAGSTVDANYHGDPAFNQTAAQEKLIHGLDIKKGKFEGNKSGATQEMNHWRKHPSGHSVFVKTEGLSVAGVESNPNNEAAYYNLARDVFGMGDYVPPVSVFRNPATGSKMSAMAKVDGGEHFRENDPIHRAAIKNMMATGDLHRLGFMDWILGHDDRHSGNYLMTPNGKKEMQLIDNSEILPSTAVTHFLPPHFLRVNDGLHRPIHDNEQDWVSSLDPNKLTEHLTKMNYPQSVAKSATDRLTFLKQLIYNNRSQGQQLKGKDIFDPEEDEKLMRPW